jgi:hypothetical protein
MNVAFAAYGFGIAQPLGDRFDGLDDIALRLGLGTEGFKLLERFSGENRARPRAKICPVMSRTY